MKLRYIFATILALAFVLNTYNLPVDYIKDLPSEITVCRSEIAELNNNGLNLKIDESASAGNIGDFITETVGLFGLKRIKTKVVNDKSLKTGGMAIGFNLGTQGVLVIGSSRENTETLIMRGDIILKVEDTEVNSANELSSELNKIENIGRPLNITILRGVSLINLSIRPIMDNQIGKYILGVWIRDNISGIGTATYVDENSRFGSLGHPITDTDTGVIFPVKNGDVYNCKIIGIGKGVSGNPGELKGMFSRMGKTIGTVDKNNQYGVYGSLANNIWEAQQSELKVSSRHTVKPGKAKIRCTVQDNIEEFDIEIIKARKQEFPLEKGMVIRITDKKLLNLTGGIVQGMSGSPIIQNNKIVGAVTHVFLNDPTKGYGLYLDWMINN